MNRKTSVLFLAVFLFQAAAAHCESVKDALNHKYKKQVLALRSPLTAGNQKFDSAGHSLKDAPNSGWLIYGGIYVEKLNLSKDTLRLEGPRAALTGKDAWPELRRVGDNTPHDEIYHVSTPAFTGSNEKPPAVPDRDEKDKVRPPRATYTPEPEFSEEARRARYQGTVVMKILINKSGDVVRVRLERSLGMGLDEKAMEGVTRWRFSPATHNGQPVAVEMNIEVSFNLY